MKKIILFVAFLLVFSGCGGSSDSNPADDNSIVLDVVADYQLENTDRLLIDINAQLEGLALADFFDLSFKIIEERDHENILASGRADEFEITGYQLNDISDDYYNQTVAIKSLIRELLPNYNRSLLSPADQLSYDIYQTYLDFEIEWSQYRDFEYPATYGFFGWPGASESFFTQVITVSSKDEAERYLELLNQFARRFEQIETLLDARAAAGIIEPAATLGFSRDSVQTMVNSHPLQTSYYQFFNASLDSLSDVTADEKQAMRDLANAIIEQRVLPAYSSLAQKMTSLVSRAPANIGFGQFTGGAEFYDFALRYFTASDISADEIHQLGLQEMDRIHAEMRVLFNQLGYPQEESIAQLLARARSEGGVISGTEAVAFYEEIIAEAYSFLPQAFATLPQQQVTVVGGSSGGYYISGSEDGSRPGAFYAQTNQNLPYYTMPTLAYHEAVPGHHLQIALSQELELPRFRREMHFTSFIEGWGLYAERLAKDLGWYQGDIYGDIGRLEYEAMRASRLVIDTGIHSKGWSYHQAENYSLVNVGQRGSIARYSVWPGQATAYMTGMLKILELRQQAQSELGDDYDIREFHETLLGNGSLPMDLLDQAVENYISNKQTP